MRLLHLLDELLSFLLEFLFESGSLLLLVSEVDRLLDDLDLNGLRLHQKRWLFEPLGGLRLRIGCFVGRLILSI